MNLQGNIWDYVVAFSGGVLVSFTPCVYPVMPIVASFIAGVNTKGTKLMGFLISLLYVFGMAITYSAFGVVAALSGKVFGQIQQTPFIYIFFANVLIFFALVLLDIIPIPMLGLNFQNKIRIKSVWSVILLGLASGLIVGPCTAPVLGTLLVYVASKQNIINGVGLLFVFAYGAGVSLILVGTFSGLLSSMPKAGEWMIRIKKLCGLILIIIAEIYLIKAGQMSF